MMNYEVVTKENINKHNLDWPQIPDQPYRIWIIEGYGFGRTNALLNLMKVGHLFGIYSRCHNLTYFYNNTGITKKYSL